MPPTRRPMLVLLAAPYRSGTGAEPTPVAADLARLADRAVA
ncbi:hypothetical protein [Modestobacter sp. SYSU DS0290]